MEITTTAGTLQPILYALKEADEEGFLIFKENQFEAVVTDPAMVLMEEAQIDEDKFDTYQPEIDEHSEDYGFDNRDGLYIGIRYDLLHSVLNQQKSTDTVEISLEEAQLVMDIEGNRFELPVLNLSVEDIPETDSLDYKAEVEVKLRDLKSALDNLALFSDSAEVTVDEDQLLMYADGEMGETEQTVTRRSFEDLRESEEDEELDDLEATSMYALDYLNTIRKACAKISSNRKNVDFSVGTDFPLKVDCSDNGRQVEFVLAPRIEEE